MEQASERKGLEQQGKELRLGPGSWRLPVPEAMGLLNGVGLAHGASRDCDLVRAPPETAATQLHSFLTRECIWSPQSSEVTREISFVDIHMKHHHH